MDVRRASGMRKVRLVAVEPMNSAGDHEARDGLTSPVMAASSAPGILGIETVVPSGLGVMVGCGLGPRAY